MALEGADFVQVFGFFHDAGQTPTESFHSAARIFESGWLAPPRYEPEWLANRHSLAAYLAFSSMTHRLPMHEASLEAFSAENR